MNKILTSINPTEANQAFCHLKDQTFQYCTPFQYFFFFSYLMNTELQKMNHNAFHGQKDVHTYM